MAPDVTTHERWTRMFVAAIRPQGGNTAFRGTEDHGRAVAVTPPAEAASMAGAGALTGSKRFALVRTLRLRRPELFAALR